MRIALASLLGFFGGALLAWALGVFVLQLHWETTLLMVEVAAVSLAILGGLIVHRRQKARAQSAGRH